MCKFYKNNNNIKEKHKNMRSIKGSGSKDRLCRIAVVVILTLCFGLQEQQQYLASAMMTPTTTVTQQTAGAAAEEDAMIRTNLTTTTPNNSSLTTLNKQQQTSSPVMTTTLPGAVVSKPPPRVPPPAIRLNKCCLYGEYLDSSKKCVPGSMREWVPRIFYMNRKTIHSPPGTSPKFITFEDNVFPISHETTTAQGEDQPDDKEAQEDQINCTVEDLEIIMGADKLLIFSNGSLYLSQLGMFIAPKRYCVDQYAALVCFPKSRSSEPSLKLRKCCSQHAVVDGDSCQLEPNTQLRVDLPPNRTYQTIYGFPQCSTETNRLIKAGDWSETQLHEASGNLYLPNYRVNLTSQEYCLDHVRQGNTTSTSVQIFACLHQFDVPAHSSPYQVATLNIGILISVVFLAATLVASYLMPTVHHVLHWRCQIYYVFCLFIGDLLLAFTQYSKDLKYNIALCSIVASGMHFFFLSAFFWLNIMCINIWWTFRDFRPSSLERNQERLRLRLYSAYAWGIPLIIATIAVCVNLVPESSLLRPGFGEFNCWFNGERLSIFAYFFGPVGILMCINIFLFISTTHQLTCGLWKRDDVKSTTEKTAIGKVCLKLVVVMGVTWIADVLSWIIGGPHSAWFATDLINVLQGVFIFIVVGCQPQVWAACKRFCCPRSRQEITNTTNGVQHSSSQGLPSMGACGGETTQNTSVLNNTIPCAVGGGGGGGAVAVGNNTTNHLQTSMTSTAKIPMETVC